MSGAPVLLLTGPPGSGKSTVGPLVAERFDRAATIEADWFFTTIAGGFIMPWLPAAHAQNQTLLRACASAAAAMSLGGYTVVVEGVLGPWYLPLLTEELARSGADVHYVVLRPPVEVILARAEARDARTPGVSPLREEGPLRQLWDAFQDLGVYENHVIDNAALDPDETAALVRECVGNGTHRL
jgi:predicted kinase